VDFGRLRIGEWLCGLAALGLLVVMFAPWYGGEAGDGTISPLETGNFSAWQAFSVVDLLLALLGAAGLSTALLASARRAPAMPIAAAVVTTGLGIVVALVLLYRLLNQPGPNDIVAVRSGAYLGLLAVVLLTAGAWLSMGDERTDAEPAPLIPAQPVPPATAAEGSAVARGVAPEPAPRPD